MQRGSVLCKAIAAVGGVLAASSGAWAHTLAAQTRAGDFTFSAAAAQIVNVPVAPGVLFSPTFAYTQGQRVVVSYTAKCAVSGANTTTYLDFNIVAINVATGTVSVLPPTSGNVDAFCTANGSAPRDGWQMNSINALLPNLPSGNYRIQVRARLNNTGGSATLGNSSLIISR